MIFVLYFNVRSEEENEGSRYGINACFVAFQCKFVAEEKESSSFNDVQTNLIYNLYDLLLNFELEI